MTGNENLRDLEEAQMAAEELIGRAMPEVADRPTPCAEWNGRELTNHLVAGQMAFAAIVSGGDPIDRNADFLGDDPLAAVRAGNDALIAALEAPGALTKTHRSPIGEVPGIAIVQLRTIEHLVHAWDLAAASGESFSVETGLAERALAGAQAMLGGVPRTGHPFGPEHLVAAQAPALDRLAGLLGRQVPWAGAPTG